MISDSGTSPWTAFEPPDHDFAVLLPHPPLESGDSASTPIGSLAITRFKASAENCDFDAGFLQRSTSALAQLVRDETILTSACDGTASHLGGRVVSSADMTIDGRLARDLVIHSDNDDRTVVLARLVLGESRIYHAIVRMPVDASASQAACARRFLDSLRILQATNPSR